MAHFDIQLTYTGGISKEFIILVNPSGIHLGDNYFPVVWKVAQFKGRRNLDIENPVKIAYNQILSALIAEIDEKNIIKVQCHETVTNKVKDFKTQANGSSFKLVPADINKNSDVSIDNNSGISLLVGIGDSKGNAYFIIQCENYVTAEFILQIEIAICPVSGYVESQQFKGDVKGEWISFKAIDVINGHVHITHDGQNFIADDPESKIFKTHDKINMYLDNEK